MKLKVFKFLPLLLLISSLSPAQTSLSGRVFSKSDTAAIKGCIIFLNENLTTITDDQGRFVFSSVPNGNYTLQTTMSGYRIEKKHFSARGKDLRLDLYLTSS